MTPRDARRPIHGVLRRSEALKGVRFSPLAAPKKHSCKEVITMADLLDNLIQLQEDEGWLTMWEVRAHLRLSRVGALRWIRKHVPPEYLGKRGNHRLVHIKGLKAGLDKCVWRPKSPKGYQGHPGRKPPNVNCRDSRGRFVSHRPASEKRPKEGGWKSSRRNKYLISDAPIKSGVQDE